MSDGVVPTPPVKEPVPTPAVEASGPSFSRTFGAFRNRDFRLMWFGAFTSTTGTWMQTVAQSWVVFSLTGSALSLGIDAFLATLPMILFSLVGGVIADRIDRRRILLFSQIFQMLFAFVLAWLIYSGRVQVWHIFILSFLTGSVQAFGAPAYQALLPLLVKRDELPNAIALNSMQFNLARMLGPVLAGLALSTVGAAACFLLNGLSFVPVIISLLLIRASFHPERANRKSMLSEMREGLSFVRRDRAILELTIIAAVSTFFGIPLITLLPVVAKEIFDLSANGYSWIMAASGAGSVCGALVVATFGQLKRKGRGALICQLVFGVCLITFALSEVLWLSVVSVFFAGASLLGVVTTVSSLVQLKTSEQLRGRVMSIFMMAFRGGMPLGNLYTGWLAERVGVTRALSMNAIILILFAGALILSRSEVEEL